MVGAADAGHVVVGGRIGLGLPGTLVLVTIGVLVGALLGLSVGGGVALWSRAQRRWSTPPHAPFVVAVLLVSALRVALGWLATSDDAVYAAAVGLGALASCPLLLRVSGGWRYGPHGLVGLLVVVAGGVGMTGGPPLVVSRVPSVDKPNVLWITYGGARADRFGTSPLDTPGFDRVASEGTQFKLAVTPSPDERTAAMAMLDGLEPWATAAEGARNLPNLLTAESLHTAAFVSTDRLGRDDRIDAGFQIYDDDHDWPKGISRSLCGLMLRASGLLEPARARRADEVVDRAIRFIRSEPGQWFVWVHLDDPMPPWQPPIPYDERYYRGSDPRAPAAITLPEGTRVDPAHGDTLDGVRDADWAIARYDGEVAYADAAVARLLRELDAAGRAQNTLVVAASLVGMALREDEVWFSPESLVEPVVHVPLAMRLPSRVPVGHGVGLPVSLVDVAPTVTELLGVHGSLGGTGVSLRPTMDGSGVARRAARTIGAGAVRPVAVRLPGALVVHDPRGRLRAWRFAEEDRGTDAWTQERVLDLLGWAVELDGSGAAAPTSIDGRSQVVMDALAPRIDPEAGVAE